MRPHTRWTSAPCLATWVCLGLLAVGLAWGPARPAEGHAQQLPSFWVDVVIEDAVVRLNVTGQRKLMAPWTALPPEEEVPEDEAVRRTALGHAVDRLRTRNPVFLDGARVVPVPKALELPLDLNDGDGPPYVKLVFEYPRTARPRSVRLVWEDFEGADYLGDPVVPLTVQVGPRVEFFTLSVQEPEITWHAEKASGVGRLQVAPVLPPPPDKIPIPLFSLGFALAAGCGGFLARRRLGANVRTAGIVVAAVAVTVLTSGFARIEVVPPWEDVVKPPSPVQALEIFEILHGNIYRAFDAGTEDEIYDLLSVSVDPSVLDELYADVYESLILRNQGGVVAQVDRVEPVDKDVELPTEEVWPPVFHVDWSWRVHCSMTHWGHTHQRVNEYEARYQVRHDGGSWKIAEVEVKERRRVEEDE